MCFSLDFSGTKAAVVGSVSTLAGENEILLALLLVTRVMASHYLSGAEPRESVQLQLSRSWKGKPFGRETARVCVYIYIYIYIHTSLGALLFLDKSTVKRKHTKKAAEEERKATTRGYFRERSPRLCSLTLSLLRGETEQRVSRGKYSRERRGGIIIKMPGISKMLDLCRDGDG